VRRASDRLRARLRARAFAGLAGDGGRHVQRRFLAGEGFFQRQLEIVAQVLPARGALLAARPAASAAHELAEEVVEDVGERG